MHKYIIQFHRGTPAESVVILEVDCTAASDIPACVYRDVLETQLKDKLDFDFTICQREGYLSEDYYRKLSEKQ